MAVRGIFRYMYVENFFLDSYMYHLLLIHTSKPFTLQVKEAAGLDL